MLDHGRLHAFRSFASDLASLDYSSDEPSHDSPDKRRRFVAAFTLVELLVVISIIGLLVGLFLPAIQVSREAARRGSCVNHMRQLTLGNLNYETAYGRLPYARKNDQWNPYTWTQLILPYIEQQQVYDLYHDIDSPDEWRPAGTIDERKRQARETQIAMFFCPSDGPPKGNELYSPAWGYWRGNYRGCTGNTDMYASNIVLYRGEETQGGGGCFQVYPGQRFFPDRYEPAPIFVELRQITDGMSNTMLISEGICPTVSNWGGALGGMLYGNMGGSLFSTWQSPNSSVPDNLYGPCPGDSNPPDAEYPNETCYSYAADPGSGPGAALSYAAARSRHPGGVNYARADASVGFASDDVDRFVWQTLSTRGLEDLAQ